MGRLMPTYLLRVSRDEPAEYVAWSTVVEAPVTDVMDLAEAAEYLRREARCPEPCCQRTQVTDRISRADRMGTSSVNGFEGWSEPYIIAQQVGLLPREALGHYAREYAETGTMPLVYLQPFEDDFAAEDMAS